MTEEEKNKKVRITNVQRFCLHDGPGIRTAIFFKGCSIHCPWCCNPENICYDLQPWQDENGESGVFGYDITLKELFDEVMKDKVFYEDEGGVTLSGGEPLLQIEKCIPLLKELKENGIRIAVETALFVGKSAVMTALDYVDWWYVDMKLVVPEMCRDVLGGDIDVYKSNLKIVAEKTKNLCIRIPGHYYVAEDENIKNIIKIIRINEIRKVELLEIHDLSEKKYLVLGMKSFDDEQKSKHAFDELYTRLIRAKVNCEKKQI